MEEVRTCEQRKSEWEKWRETVQTVIKCMYRCYMQNNITLQCCQCYQDLEMAPGSPAKGMDETQYQTNS